MNSLRHTDTIIVSVIVPVYNVEKYLSRCVDSLINQTFCNFEIILVDDGSTDGSALECDCYAENYSHVKVIHQKNAGLSEARNSGMRIAQGKYITFVDSDDWVADSFLEDMVKLAEEYELDIVSVKEKRTNGDIVFERKDFNYTVYKDKCVDVLFGKNIPNYAWGKLYKKEIFDANNIFFTSGIKFEDLDILYRLYDLSQKVGTIDSNFYYFYFQREGSIVHTVSHTGIQDIFDILSRIENYEFIQKPQYYGMYMLFKYFDLMSMVIRMNTVSVDVKNNYIRQIYKKVKGIPIGKVKMKIETLKVILIKIHVADKFLKLKYRGPDSKND